MNIQMDTSAKIVWHLSSFGIWKDLLLTGLFCLWSWKYLAQNFLMTFNFMPYLSELNFWNLLFMNLIFELDFLLISNLIFTACVACKNPVRNRQKIKLKNQVQIDKATWMSTWNSHFKKIIHVFKSDSQWAF